LPRNLYCDQKHFRLVWNFYEEYVLLFLSSSNILKLIKNLKELYGGIEYNINCIQIGKKLNGRKCIVAYYLPDNKKYGRDLTQRLHCVITLFLGKNTFT